MNVRFKYVKDDMPVDVWEDGASLALDYSIAPVIFVQNNWHYAILDDKYLAQEYTDAQINEARSIIAFFEQRREEIHGDTGYSLSMEELIDAERLAKLQTQELLPLRQGGEVPIYDAASRVVNSANNIDAFNARLNNFATSVLEQLSDENFLDALNTAFIELKAATIDRINDAYEAAGNPVYYDHTNIDPAVKANFITAKDRMIGDVNNLAVTDNLGTSVDIYKQLQNYQVSF